MAQKILSANALLAGAVRVPKGTTPAGSTRSRPWDTGAVPARLISGTNVYAGRDYSIEECSELFSVFTGERAMVIGSLFHAMQTVITIAVYLIRS